MKTYKYFSYFGIFILYIQSAIFSGCATTKSLIELAIEEKASIIDLSHSVKENSISKTAGYSFQKEPIRSQKNGVDFFEYKLSFPDTISTNMETSGHFVEAGNSVDKLPLAKLIGYGAVFDIHEMVKQNPSYQLSKKDIDIWESKHGSIPTEAILLIYTGWSNKWPDFNSYSNINSSEVESYPGISPEAIDFLIRERKVHAVGIDTFSPYLGNSNSNNQRAFLNAGKYYLNNLTNLDKLPARGSIVMALPIKLDKVSSSPVRVLAIIPQDKTEIEPGKKKVQQTTETGADPTQQQGNRGSMTSPNGRY